MEVFDFKDSQISFSAITYTVPICYFVYIVISNITSTLFHFSALVRERRFSYTNYIFFSKFTHEIKILVLYFRVMNNIEYFTPLR